MRLLGPTFLLFAVTSGTFLKLTKKPEVNEIVKIPSDVEKVLRETAHIIYTADGRKHFKRL